MLVLIIPISLLVFFYSFESRIHDWRHAWLETFVLFGTLSALIVETLSLFSQIRQATLFSAWLICNLAIIAYLFLSHRLTHKRPRFSLKNFGSFRQSITELNFHIYYILLIFLLVGVTALKSPPLTVDVLVYHMGRVMNWLQNQNVIHYPTNISRQLDQPPASSFILLHLQSLAGTDLWAGLVQWFSMVGAVIGVSLVARELGANSRGQILAALIAATLPLGILQASTAQNDYVVTFWLVCCTYGILYALNHPNNFHIFVFTGLSLGLACLTKAIAYIYAFPLLCLLFLALLLRYFKRDKQKLLSVLIILIGSILLLNLGHWLRNYQVFGSPTGVIGDTATTQIRSVSAFISGVIRALAIHFAVPFNIVNNSVEAFVVWVHKVFLHLDVNDPRTTYAPNGLPFKVAPWETNEAISRIYLSENSATSFLHFILIAIGTVIYCLKKRLRSPVRSGYVLTLYVALILLSGAVKWMPSVSRYQMPFFLLFSAMLGFLFSEVLSRKSFLTHILVASLVLASLPSALFSYTRPLMANSFYNTSFSILPMSREDIRWARQVQEEYKTAVQAIQPFGCSDVALDMLDHMEYSIWVAFQETLVPGQEFPRFQSVYVTNASKEQTMHPSRQGEPCAVFVMNRGKLRVVKDKKVQLNTDPNEKYVLDDKPRDRLLTYRPLYKTANIAAYILSDKP